MQGLGIVLQNLHHFTKFAFLYDYLIVTSKSNHGQWNTIIGQYRIGFEP